MNRRRLLAGIAALPILGLVGFKVRNDLDYVNIDLPEYYRLRADYMVIVDGKIAKGVQEANVREGWVVAYGASRNELGHIDHPPKKVYGRVQIVKMTEREKALFTTNSVHLFHA